MVDQLATQERVALYYIALQHVPGLGPKRQAHLFQYFKDLRSVLTASDSELNKALGQTKYKTEIKSALRQLRDNPSQSPSLENAKRDMALCQQNGWYVLSQQDPCYPELLKQIDTAPSLLYVNGDVDLLSKDQIAMVGSRHASASGMYTAEKLASELAIAGFVVTSGMALGIDSACHQAALKANKPTIAVLGSGLDKIYPRRNAHLAEDIANSGALVSEFPIQTAPHPGNFPQRNRIVSGLSRAVIVVEAAKRSGSLITARFALEQNRDVYAVPGSLHNPQSEGCNELIKQGASLLSSVEDLVPGSGFGINSASSNTKAQTADREVKVGKGVLDQLPKAEREATMVLATVLSEVGFEPTSLEDIERRTKIAVLDLTPLLVELQLSGRVQQQGAFYTRVR